VKDSEYELRVLVKIHSGQSILVPSMVTITLSDGQQWFAQLVGADRIETPKDASHD
jgi:ribosomal protein S19